MGDACLIACSSVPDIVFVDEIDADGSGTNGEMGSEAGEGGGSAGVQLDAGNVMCPDTPPPQGAGVCCGSRLCVRCKENQCDRCVNANCADAEICCRKGASNNISCGTTCE